MRALADTASMTTAARPTKSMKQDHINRLHRCDPAHTALLVVDMQHGFLDQGASLEVPLGREIIPNIRQLMKCCRIKGVPVIFTQFVYSSAVPCLRGEPFGIEHLPAASDRPTGFGYPSNNCLIGVAAGKGAESAEIIGELAPQPDELVIPGHTYDKFYGTPLDLALRSRRITHLLVTGVTSDICVNCTILAAANRNYYVTAVKDGVATIEQNLQEACFRIWERKFARLLTTAETILELKSSPPTPASRTTRPSRQRRESRR
jgi:ureidoacrylate peracid hydrolase